MNFYCLSTRTSNGVTESKSQLNRWTCRYWATPPETLCGPEGPAPVRSSRKPSDSKSSPCFPPTPSSEPSLQKQRYHHCTALWKLSLAPHHRTPTWFRWARMKAAVMEREERWHPRHPAGSGRVTAGWGRFQGLIQKEPSTSNCLILLHHPCCFLATVLAFKGQTALDFHIQQQKKTPWYIASQKSTRTEKYAHIRWEEKT